MLEIDESLFPPDLILELFPRQYLTRASGKESKQPGCLRAQGNSVTGFAKFASLRVQVEDTKPNDGRMRVGSWHSLPPFNCAAL